MTPQLSSTAQQRDVLKKAQSVEKAARAQLEGIQKKMKVGREGGTDPSFKITSRVDLFNFRLVTQINHSSTSPPLSSRNPRRTESES